MSANSGSFRHYADKVASQWQYGLPLAAGLAALPFPHWPAIVIATLLLLRTGSRVAMLGFVGVLAICYLSGQNYSTTGFPQAVAPFLMAFLPIGIAAYLLHRTQSLAVAFESYFFIIIAFIVVNFLINGPAELEKWIAFFNCRKKLIGTTEVDVLSQVYSLPSEDILMFLIRVWPALFFAVQCLILCFARYLQAYLYYPGGFKSDFHGLKASKITAILAALFFCAVLFAPNVTDYAILFQLGGLGLVFLAVMGLGRVHSYLAPKKRSVLLLGAVYLLLLLMGLWVLIALAAIGLVNALTERHPQQPTPG